MTNINTNIYNIQELELQKSLTQELFAEKQKSELKADNNTEATKNDVSESLKADFNKVLSREDLIVEKINSAQTIYESLTNIRIELAGMLRTLQDKDLIDTVEKIKELDAQSNTLIDKTINVIKNNDKYGLLDSQYLNSFFKGMSSLKLLNLDDENYLNKINSIMSGVTSNQDKYNQITETLYNEYVKNSEQYIKNNVIQESDSNSISKSIVNSDIGVLFDSMKILTPEIVMGLLQN